MTTQLRLWLISLILLALALRLLAVGRDSLWLDEAISYLAATLSLPDILNNTIQDPHPPLYYVMLHQWQALGLAASDGLLRVSSIIWDLLLIPTVYVLAIRLFANRRLGLLAAGLITISPFHILYSHELRMYTLLMLLNTLVVLFYWRATTEGRRRWWVFFTLFAVLALYTHLFSGLVLLGIGLFSLHFWRSEPRKLWGTVLCGTIILAAFIPWLVMMQSDVTPEAGTLRPLFEQRDNFNPIKLLTSFYFLVLGQSSSLWYTGLGLFLLLTLALILLLEIIKLRRQKSDTTPVTYLGLITLCVIGLPNLVYLARPFFLPERTMAAAAPFLVILIAWCLLRRGSPLPFLAGVLVVLMLVGTLSYLRGDRLKPPYREAIGLVSAQQRPSDLVLHTSDGSFLPALRYAAAGPQRLLAGDPLPRKTEAVYEAFGGSLIDPASLPENIERLWLVIALEHSVAWQNDQAAYFADQFTLLQSEEIGGIQIKLYDVTR